MMFEKVLLKFDGRCHEWSVSELDMPLEEVTDVQVMTAVHQRLSSLGIPVDNMSGYTVDPPEGERLSGLHEDKTVLSIRPSATYAKQ